MPRFNRLERARKLLSRFGAMAIDLVFPIECFGCAEEGKWICPKCFQSLKFSGYQYCLECKEKTGLGEFCDDCRPEYYLDGVLIAGDYENELLSQTIKNIKYHLVRGAAHDLGKYLAAFLVKEINKNKVSAGDIENKRVWEKIENAQNRPGFIFNLEEALFIPVPLHPRRERSRGFNQATEIAKELAAGLSLNIKDDCLIRKVHRPPQAKLGEKERKINIAGAYGWTGKNLRGRNVILIDDVVTTGSTLNECAKVLKQNGAGVVWGLVVAKG